MGYSGADRTDFYGVLGIMEAMFEKFEDMCNDLDISGELYDASGDVSRGAKELLEQEIYAETSTIYTPDDDAYKMIFSFDFPLSYVDGGCKIDLIHDSKGLNKDEWIDTWWVESYDDIKDAVTDAFNQLGLPVKKVRYYDN